MVRHLVYVSKAKEEISKEDIQSILEAANRNNEQEKLTGLLLYRPPYFVQFLEGTEFGLQKIMSKIEKDERHSQVETIYDGQTQERIFPDWNMGHIEGEKASPEDIKQLTKILNDSETLPEEKVVKALKTFSATDLSKAGNS